MTEVLKDKDKDKMEGSTGQRTSCDACKRSKLKCIKQGEKCTRCIARNTECTVTLVGRKKREKKIHYLSAIEDRMKRMESAMSANGLSIADPEMEPTSTSLDSQAALSDKLSMFMISDNGKSAFVGASSGFSLFSPQGLNWISQKTGNRDFENIVKSISEDCDTGPVGGTHNFFLPLPVEQREPLPEKEVADMYLETYFDYFNSSFPLYDRDKFYERYATDYYTASPENDSAWYAALNIMFVVGCAILKRGSGPDELCKKYFRNAACVFSELLFCGTSLSAVQAMIGMAFILQAGEDPHPSYVLAGAAGRLAQAIGLHRRLDIFGLSDAEMAQRQNVFWIAFMLEKGISIRSGRPSVFNDDDIGVALPKSNPVANANLSSENSVLDVFHQMATLALLESRVYSKLYSARSQTKPEIERLKWVGLLDKELQQWRNGLPFEIRPEQPMTCHTKHLMHVIMLHFAYYNCLVAIHRGSVHHGSWLKKDDEAAKVSAAGLNPRVFQSARICLEAARNVIGLLHYYEKSDELPNLGIVSMCNYYPLTASLTLFAHILQNPSLPTALSDIALMNAVTSVLGHSFQRTSAKAITTMAIFKEITRVAAQAVARAQGSAGVLGLGLAIPGGVKEPLGKATLDGLRRSDRVVVGPGTYAGVAAQLTPESASPESSTSHGMDVATRPFCSSSCAPPTPGSSSESIAPSSGRSPELSQLASIFDSSPGESVASQKLSNLMHIDLSNPVQAQQLLYIKAKRREQEQRLQREQLQQQQQQNRNENQRPTRTDAPPHLPGMAILPAYSPSFSDIPSPNDLSRFDFSIPSTEPNASLSTASASNPLKASNARTSSEPTTYPWQGSNPFAFATESTQSPTGDLQGNDNLNPNSMEGSPSQDFDFNSMGGMEGMDMGFGGFEQQIGFDAPMAFQWDLADIWNTGGR